MEATTGNTGIAFAALAAIYGLKAILVMPENSSQERVLMMRKYGAEVVLTPENQGPLGAIQKRDEIAQRNIHTWIPGQFT